MEMKMLPLLLHFGTLTEGWNPQKWAISNVVFILDPDPLLSGNASCTHQAHFFKELADQGMPGWTTQSSKDWLWEVKSRSGAINLVLSATILWDLWSYDFSLGRMLFFEQIPVEELVVGHPWHILIETNLLAICLKNSADKSSLASRSLSLQQ